MIETLPLYIVVVFIITTLATVGIFQYAVKRAAFNSRTSNIISFVLPFWLFLQATLSITSFFLNTESLPPRFFVFAVLPPLLAIIALLSFSRKFVEQLPLKVITLISIVRIPVELVLLWLFQNGLIPQVMTFEGRNFDIISGITAPIVVWFAFRGGKINRTVLVIWNLLGLLLLVNIVSHAALSLPSPIQQISFDQPNRAVLYFPFIWLPSTIVPIILFCHLASLWQLFRQK